VTEAARLWAEIAADQEAGLAVLVMEETDPEYEEPMDELWKETTAILSPGCVIVRRGLD